VRPKPLAVIRTYAELRAALRKRVADLGVSFETVDTISGVQDRYTSKILGPRPPRSSMRVFGHHTLDFMLSVLGLQLVIVEDPEAMAKVRSRLVPAQQNMIRRHDTPPLKEKAPDGKNFAACIRAGELARFNAMNQAERTRLGKLGAQARRKDR
jgi:hypothetical protein